MTTKGVGGAVVETDVARGRFDVGDTEPVIGAASGPRRAATSATPRRKMLHSVAVVVFVLGLAVTATLSLTARSLHDSNEDRLLHQRVSEVGTVLTAAIPNLQTPLSSGAVLAEATNANPRALTSFLAPMSTGRPFVSLSVWRLHTGAPSLLLLFGHKPELAGRGAAQVRDYLEQTTRTQVNRQQAVSVLDLLGASQRRLGFGFAIGPSAKYVVYAESALPQNRRSTVDSNSAFSDLDYAIYLGTTDDPRSLLASSVADPHFTGRTAGDTAAFGNSSLRIVMTPRRELGGNLLARLPWLIGALGVAIALAAGLMTEHLVRRRANAEQLARQNARLFSEQRSVAQTLQHSLLPEEKPEFPGLDLSVRYVPGADGVDIGGDWYDVIGIDDRQVMLVVGDVSGRGLRAATQMAALRYAIRAYAAQGDRPEVILSKLARLINIVRDGHFATVLCGLVNVAERQVTFANAGHPNPLLIDGARAEFVATRVGPPVGVATTEFESVVVTVPPNGTLLAYTDGLFERRGESPDAGLARLRSAATGRHSLEELLDGLLRVLNPDGGHDDTAILAMRWLR
jgi:serine phosphatase RsbU (regulator of sigma subunit)